MDDSIPTQLMPGGGMPDEELAVVGFLARYSGVTRKRYGSALRLLFAWCSRHRIPVLQIKRPQLELFVRDLETERGNLPSTVNNTMSTVRTFYKFAVIDGYIEKSPAEHVRKPRAYRDESRTLGLDRDELLLLLRTAQASSPMHGALIGLMGMLGLRVSEACSVKIEDYNDVDRGHRVLHTVGKGKKPATIPLPAPVLAILEEAAAGRKEGLLLLGNGRPMNRDSAAWVVDVLRRRAGIKKRISPHSLRRAFVTACLDAGVPLRDVQIAARHSDPRVTAGYDRGRNNLDRHAVHTLMNYLNDRGATGEGRDDGHAGDSDDGDDRSEKRAGQ